MGLLYRLSAKDGVASLLDTEAVEPTEGEERFVPELGMSLVYVAPGGSFEMGSDTGYPEEKPAHDVTLSRGFWIGKYGVTQAEYEQVIGTNPSYFRGTRHPVHLVSWGDATAFCAKLTERERAAGRLALGYGYRLPTEAEWEYAARGGAQTRGYAYSGSDRVDEVAWHKSNSGDRMHPVGLKKPNELGLCDMSGNVWEWCLDWYGDYPAGAVTDPMGPPQGSAHVFRGGGWDVGAAYCRLVYRGVDAPSYSRIVAGFRVSLGPLSGRGPSA